MTRRRTPVVSPAGGVKARKARRRIVESVLLILGCILLGDAVIGERGVVAMMRAREEYRIEEQRLEAARAENARLREEAKLLREDAATIEDVARRELGLIKPGEKLFTIKDIPPAAAGH